MDCSVWQKNKLMSLKVFFLFLLFNLKLPSQSIIKIFEKNKSWVIEETAFDTRIVFS